MAFWTFVLNLFLSLVLMGRVDAVEGDNPFVLAVAFLSQGVGALSLSYAGLALANSLSATFQFAALMWLATRRLGGFAWREYISSLWRNLTAAAVMAGPLFLVAGRTQWDLGSGTLLVQVLSFLGLVAGGVALYTIAVRLLGSPDWPVARNVGIALMERFPVRVRR